MLLLIQLFSSSFSSCIFRFIFPPSSSSLSFFASLHSLLFFSSEKGHCRAPCNTLTSTRDLSRELSEVPDLPVIDEIGPIGIISGPPPIFPPVPPLAPRASVSINSFWWSIMFFSAGLILQAHLRSNCRPRFFFKRDEGLHWSRQRHRYRSVRGGLQSLNLITTISAPRSKYDVFSFITNQSIK